MITGPGPVSLVHKPLPITGVFPFNVIVLTPHVFTTDWVAVATVAGAVAVIITVSLLAEQPGVDRLHSNRYVPLDAPVTVVFCKDELAMVGVIGPLTNFQVPVSIPTGAFPANWKVDIASPRH
jgi:hypothetical protein